MGEPAGPARRGDRDVAPIAALFGDPARAAMLAALAAGRALPDGELARVAGVHPATATAHLRRLIEAGLVRVGAQGRHRYHELAGPEVAAVLEALARLSPPVPIRSLRQQHDADALSEARTCYDHLAGRRGGQLRDRLLGVGALQLADGDDHALTGHGRRLISELGIDPGPWSQAGASSPGRVRCRRRTSTSPATGSRRTSWRRPSRRSADTPAAPDALRPGHDAFPETKEQRC